MDRRRWPIVMLGAWLLAAPALAEDKPATEPPAAPTADAAKPAAATAAKPPAATDAVVLDAASLEAIIGRSVKSPTGEDMGRIVDVLLPPNGQVRAAVIDFGGFLGVGSRKIAVDWKALNFTDIAKSGNLIVALTRNQVRMAPEYKQGDPIVVLEATTPEQAKALEKPPAPQPPAASTPSASPPAAPAPSDADSKATPPPADPPK